MIPALLAPAALGALLAVLVPLAIHIARRTETQVIDFAALRWLNPNPRPVRRLRLDERLLLAARIVLVAADRGLPPLEADPTDDLVDPVDDVLDDDRGLIALESVK